MVALPRSDRAGAGDASAGTIPHYTVIDGQQRLTTLQILLAASTRVAREAGADREAQLLRELVVNNPLRASGDDVFKVWPTNTNRRAFKAVMAEDGPATGLQDDPENLVEEAYEYFTSALREWLEDAEEDERVRRVETLHVTLCDLLKLVSITLEPGDNAQVIFETLNARGTPLLALDLVKNAVFHEAAKQELPIDELYDEIWKPQLDDDYWRVEVRQGRLFRPRAELFLMHWLGMKLRRVIPATELFATFRQEILQPPSARRMDDLIIELCRDAEILRSFDHQPAGSVENVFFARLAHLDTTTVMPLVLFLFCEPTITPERRIRAIGILESWLVRRTLMRLTTKNYNQQIGAMLEKIDADPRVADEIVLSHLRAATGDATRWPTDEELIAYLETHTAYGNIAQGRLVMALAAIEQSLYTNKVEALSIPSDLSLEHIMPQGWQRNWRLATDLDADQVVEAKLEREQRIHRLGNLTVTTLPLNSSMSNAAWVKKRNELNKHSKLLLNGELVDRWPEVFDDASIDTRTRELAERLCKIWRSPAAEWMWPSSDAVSESFAPAQPAAASSSQLSPAAADVLGDADSDA